MSNVLKFNPINDNVAKAISLTPNAVSHIQKTIEKQGKGQGLRLIIKKTGCSGYSYHVDILDEPTPEEAVFRTSEGLLIAVAASFLPIVQGTSIDYEESTLNSGFKFDNPNQKAVCGCGESFTV